MLNPKMQIVKSQLEACGLKVNEPVESYIVQVDLSKDEAIFVENDENVFQVSYETLGSLGFVGTAADTVRTDDVYRAIRLALSMYEEHN